MKPGFVAGDSLGTGACGFAALTLVAVTTWHWTTPEILPEITAATANVSPRTALVATETPPDFREIARWHLFGEAVEDTPVGVDATADADRAELESLENLPASVAPLQVTGIVSANSAGAARAVIMDSAGRQSENAIGDQLPGNIELHAIERGRVVIRRNGVLEAIALPQPTELMPHRPAHTQTDATPLTSAD